ncbi:B-cell receptor CD22-like, partial [Clarias magur]
MLFSQFIHRALGSRWSVTYSPEHLCALKRSTVFMNASYTHPTGVKVLKSFWVIDPVKDKEPTDLRDEPGYSGRVNYSGDKQKHVSLRLSEVKKTDEHQYCIRVLGQKSTDNYLFYPGVILSVTELQVEFPETVVEGNKTVLVCSTTCSLSHTPAFIWYRNGLRIDNSINHTLTLQPTKADDAGSYSCAVRGYEEHRSPARNLAVMYPPKNITVFVRPSGKLAKDSSVTLTCSSDANPPVENYTWFKQTTLVGKEKTYTITKISSEDSGKYKCKCSNEVGHQYSIGVALDIDNGVQPAVIAGIIACLSSLVLVLIIVLLRRKKMYCWSKESKKHENVDAEPAPHNTPHSNTDNQDEVQYASIVHARKPESATLRAPERDLYANVQHQRGKAGKNNQEDDVQYATTQVSSSN